MKIQYKKKDIRKWHTKFAWLPTKVDDSDDVQTIVWFERYMRKEQKYVTSSKTTYWYKFSQKEYFKRQLARKLPGEIYSDAECDRAEGSHGVPGLKPASEQIKELQARDRKHNQ